MIERRKKVVYWTLAAILAGALLVLFLARGNLLVQVLAGITAAGSLLVALLGLLYDEVKHQRTLAAESKERSFLWGATTHMANVAFDKHVAFIEAYFAESQSAIQTLLREGPVEAVLPHAHTLHGIRQTFAPWLTEALDTQLEQFESTFREIGSKALYVRVAPDGEKWQEFHGQIYKRFAEVMGSSEWEGEELTQERTATVLLARLRAVLGIEELTAPRASLASAAIAEGRMVAKNT